MDITIEYCMMWNYEPRALSLRESLKKQFGIKAKMIESSGGVFEVTLNNSLIFSKKDLGRFPTKNEIEDLLEGYQKVIWQKNKRVKCPKKRHY